MARHNDKSIKDVLGDFMASNKKVAKGYHTSKIEEVWKQEMGSMISGYTSKLYFKEGVLKVYLTSSALKKELLFGKAKIIKNMNEALGIAIITEVEIY
jgi:hypothetical protein